MVKRFRSKILGRGQLRLLAAGFVVAVFLNPGVASSADELKSIGADKTTKARSTLTKTEPGEYENTKRLLVKFKGGVSSLAKSRLHASMNSKSMKSLRSVTGLEVVELAPGKDIYKAITEYEKDPQVIYAEPDYKIKLKVIPNDPSFSDLWGLNNTGQTGGSSNADINAPQAWDVTQGSSDVVVAVVDTGVDYEHEDLAANMWTNTVELNGTAGVDDDNNGYIDDIYGIDAGDGDSDPMDTEGHGTHIAGTIGAIGNNGIGVTGVNWNVSIIACKIFSSTNGQDVEAFVSDAVECLDYLYDLKMNQGINIVATNNSWGWIGNPSQTLVDAIQRQQEAEILFIAASGNESLNTDDFLDNPSGYYIPNVISVAASTDTDALAIFSNRGRRTVHVAAPGQDILSTVPEGAISYDTFSGTSMATPHVVGLAALIKSDNSARTWDEIKNLIISSGTRRSSFVNNTVSGRRISAFDTNTTGALTCSNQTVLARLQPRIDEYAIEPGELVNISMLNINCGEPAGSISVNITETGDTVELLDNGLGYDQIAGDGIYSAQIDLDTLDLQAITLNFPDSTTVNVNTVFNYMQAVPNTYEWRTVSAAAQPVFTGSNGDPYDDQTVYRNTPFGIPFANTTEPYTRLAIDSNGYIIMQWIGEPAIEISIYENFELPLVGLSNMVAVFWDDLVIDDIPGTNVYWDVLGSAPDRELVITWQNVRPYGGEPGLTFQVVFSENSSDIVVNYQDMTIPDPFTDDGISATAGIQVAPNIGTQYSYNTPSLTSGTSLRWSMADGAVNTPTIPPPTFRPTPGGGGGNFGLWFVFLISMFWVARQKFRGKIH